MQWHGDSHLFDTWHTVREVHALCESGRGLKKLSNFIARERETAELRESVSREEVEQMNVAAEMWRQEREEWVKVEKVIASREQPTYLVRHLQRIRKRRRTFTLPPDTADTEEDQQGEEVKEAVKEEKEEQVVTVVQQMETEDMRIEVEEKTTITTVTTDTSPPPPLSSQPLSLMAVDSDPEPPPTKDEESNEADMQDDPSPPSDDDDDEELYDDGTTISQFLVKWHGLAHEDCTWECADDIAAYQPAIDDFLDLERMSSARPHAGGLNRKFRKITEQPAYLNQGVLREYQIQGLEWLVHNWCEGINSSPLTCTPHTSLDMPPLPLSLHRPMLTWLLSLPSCVFCDVVLADEMGLGQNALTAQLSPLPVRSRH